MWVEHLVILLAGTEATPSLQARDHVNDVLGYRWLDEGDSVELSQETGEPKDVCSGFQAQGDGACMLSGEGV